MTSGLKGTIPEFLKPASAFSRVADLVNADLTKYLINIFRASHNKFYLNSFTVILCSFNNVFKTLVFD